MAACITIHVTDFLEAIRRNPDDDAARLVWADALEEEGDPRAQYLRLEVTWRRIRAKDPLYRNDWECVLLHCGANKIGCIKAIREITGLGLKDAKDLAEAAPRRVQFGLTLREAMAEVQWFERVSPFKNIGISPKAEVRRVEGVPTPLEAAWLKLYAVSKELTLQHADWMRSINRLVSLWVPQALAAEETAVLDKLVPESYLERMFLSRAWNAPAGAFALREGLERHDAEIALANLPPEAKAEIRPSNCFFDWPSGC